MNQFISVFISVFFLLSCSQESRLSKPNQEGIDENFGNLDPLSPEEHRTIDELLTEFSIMDRTDKNLKEKLDKITKELEEKVYSRLSYGRIGKVNVRLWQKEQEQTQVSTLPTFLSSEAAQWHYLSMINAMYGSVDKGFAEKSHLVFMGCETTFVRNAIENTFVLLGNIGNQKKQEFSPRVVGGAGSSLQETAEAVEGCAPLLTEIKPGKFRQFEYLIDDAGYQHILVSSDIFQGKTAHFKSKEPLNEYVFVFTRPFSTRFRVHGTLVNRLMREGTGTERDLIGNVQNLRLKSVLALGSKPLSLGHASSLWYQRDKNFHRRLAVIKSTIDVEIALLGMYEIKAGLAGLKLMQTGLTTLPPKLLANHAFLVGCANTVAKGIGMVQTYRFVPGALVALTSLLDASKASYRVSLIQDRGTQQNLISALQLLNFTTAFVGIANLIISHPAIYRAGMRFGLKKLFGMAYAAESSAKSVGRVTYQYKVAITGGFAKLGERVKSMFFVSPWKFLTRIVGKNQAASALYPSELVSVSELSKNLLKTQIGPAVEVSKAGRLLQFKNGLFKFRRVAMQSGFEFLEETAKGAIPNYINFKMINASGRTVFVRFPKSLTEKQILLKGIGSMMIEEMKPMMTMATMEMVVQAPGLMMKLFNEVGRLSFQIALAKIWKEIDRHTVDITFPENPSSIIQDLREELEELKKEEGVQSQQDEDTLAEESSNNG